MCARTGERLTARFRLLAITATTRIDPELILEHINASERRASAATWPNARVAATATSLETNPENRSGV
jgi:hypothetical protein